MSFEENEKKILNLFSASQTPEAIYEKILEIGKNQAPLLGKLKKQVPGCQSSLFLHTFVKGDLFYFETESDALISAGLGQLICLLYSGLSASEIVKNKPAVFEKIGLVKSLSPNRSNGLSSLELTLKQEVIKFL